MKHLNPQHHQKKNLIIPRNPSQKPSATIRPKQLTAPLSPTVDKISTLHITTAMSKYSENQPNHTSLMELTHLQTVRGKESAKNAFFEAGAEHNDIVLLIHGANRGDKSENDANVVQRIKRNANFGEEREMTTAFASLFPRVPLCSPSPRTSSLRSHSFLDIGISTVLQ